MQKCDHPPIPDGWRELGFHEVIIPGDMMGTPHSWIDTSSMHGDTVESVNADPQTGQVNHYYTIIRQEKILPATKKKEWLNPWD